MCETPIKNKLLIKTKCLSIPPSPLMQTLGYGTGVTVYKMLRSPSRSPWVLKKISRKARDADEMNMRLNFEAGILKSLKHPNVVGFRAFITESDGRKCIAMEACTISLGDLIEKRVEDGIDKPFDAKCIERVAVDVAEGLQYLHSEALVLHCDIKSYNILVKDNFTICKICDFGVSMPLKADGALDLTKAADEPEYVGTPCWCAPEILQSKQIITDKADIYSYGLCIWEMIALEPPNSGENESFDDSFSKLEVTDDGVENDLDDSFDDMEEENYDKDTEEKSRQRPKIPCEYLDDSYLGILQVYYLCTETDYKKRLNAKALCMLTKELFKA